MDVGIWFFLADAALAFGPVARARRAGVGRGGVCVWV